MSKTNFIVVLFIMHVLHTGYAAEVDSVTFRTLKLENSLTLLNDIFNHRIQVGIEKANQRQEDYENIPANEFCDRKILYTELRKAIFQSITASWGLKGYSLDKQLRQMLISKSYSLPLNESIYRDIDYLEGISLNLKELTDVVNINGHTVGLDKLGHFFAEGWQYFEMTHYDNQSIDTAMLWGREQEIGKYGYASTGIFSYADLVANFNGWRFWNQMLLDRKDPLKGFIGNSFNRSYITCGTQFVSSLKSLKIVKAWEFRKKLDFSDYVDGMWDEANNCNSYKDPVIEEKVAARVGQIMPEYFCPLSTEGCIHARKRYSIYAGKLLHPLCLVAKPE